MCKGNEYQGIISYSKYLALELECIGSVYVHTTISVLTAINGKGVIGSVLEVSQYTAR